MRERRGPIDQHKIAASSLSDVLSSAIFVRPCTASRSYEPLAQDKNKHISLFIVFKRVLSTIIIVILSAQRIPHK